MHLYHFKNEHIHLSYRLDKTPKEQQYEIHMHNDYELYCFISGDARYMIEGREIPLKYGTVLVMRPGELHTLLLDSDQPYERFVVNFTPEILPEELREPLLAPLKNRPLGEMNVFRAADFSGVTPRDLLNALCTENDCPELRIRTLFPALLMLLQNSPHPTSGIGRTEGIEILDYVNARLCDPVTVTEVAEHFYMSVSQVSRIFKNLTGTTVGQYSLTKRLLKARRRMDGGMSAKDAALACGFQYYSSFYRLYKKKFGISPSEEERRTP